VPHGRINPRDTEGTRREAPAGYWRQLDGDSLMELHEFAEEKFIERVHNGVLELLDKLEIGSHKHKYIRDRVACDLTRRIVESSV
jgi:hypothetical protein